ncbi:MAG: hypothetical protein ATN33_04230 [Epulopiscium sp. Nele67-Bin001]|nr:MAG: hypothetical protein ATN33_04230 [Epulopiscium sp. Nele67-Bin001]
MTTSTKKDSHINITHKLTLGLIFVLLLFFIHRAYYYFNPSIYGSWVSQITNEQITFNKNGTIVLENESYSPNFEIISPTKIRYIVGGKGFEMYYAIEGRTLYWGMDENSLEVFIKR